MKYLSYFVAILLLVLLFLGGPEMVSLRSFGEMWNLGHILAFSLWFWLAFRAGPLSRWSWGRQAALAPVAALALGVATEWLQVRFRRSPDVGDLGRDLLGTFLVLAFFVPSRRQLPPAILRGLQGACVFALALAFVPVVTAGVDDLRARTQFPLLADFESPLEVGRWQEGRARMTPVKGPATHGEGSLRVDLTTERYSGVYLKYFPEDWRGYRTLRFDVFNPGDDPLALHLRIHDSRHRGSGQKYSDRYNSVFHLEPGWNAFSVDLKSVERAPRGRSLDMGAIERVGFFVGDLPSPRTIYLDHLRLDDSPVH